MSGNIPHRVELIPISEIHVLNPRKRDKAKFQKVVESIKAVGLKRPIKVSPRKVNGRTNGKKYNLVCGQGRLEAFSILEETEIPAMVVELSEEECFLQSLIENMARRQRSSLELIREIEHLSERGYEPKNIAQKTGLSTEYVTGLLRLFEDGEERLLRAVENGKMPVSVAVEISMADDKDAQLALTQAYERNELRGRKLQKAMQIVKDRRRFGKAIRDTRIKARPKKFTANSIIKAYKDEAQRQKTLVRRAHLTESRLAVIRSAFQVLFADDHFVTLLRAEGLDTMPNQLAEMLSMEAKV